MDIEIELKLLATETAGQDIKNWLQNTYPSAIIEAPVELANYYYDTQDRQLRQADMGLRIRSCNGVFEQTIKTRGSAIGGLHQRPEYNVVLPAAQLNLPLFPSHIWPKHLTPFQLQLQLDVLFTTGFRRQIMLLTLECHSVVEIVFDLGQITTVSGATPNTTAICELELELKQGHYLALFQLAKQICQITPVHFGNVSKAARGYYLLDGAPAKVTLPLPMLPIMAQHGIEDGFSVALEYALSLWQGAAVRYFELTELTELDVMLSGINLLNYTLELYQAWLPFEVLQPLKNRLRACYQRWQWLQTALCYKALCASESGITEGLDPTHFPGSVAMADPAQQKRRAQSQLNSAEDLHLQLDIVQLLLGKGWRHGSQSYQLPLLGLINGRVQGYLQKIDPTLDDDNRSWSERLECLNQLLAMSTLWGNLVNPCRGDEKSLWSQRLAGVDHLAQLHLFQQSLEDNAQHQNQNQNRQRDCSIEFSTLIKQNEKSARQLLAALT